MGTNTLRLSKRVHRSEDEFKDLKKSWNKLVEIAGADVFQLHEWQYSWWNTFGSNKKLNIVTYWLEEELIAILPFFIEEKKSSRLRFIKSLQLIGSHITTAEGGILPVDMAFGGYLDIIINPTHLELISKDLPVLFKELMQEVDQINLDEIPEHSLLMHCLPSFKDSDDWNLKETEASICNQCLIGSNWDRYLGTLGKSTRKHMRRGLRNIYDDKVFDIKKAETKEEFIRILDDLVRLHQKRWRQLNMPGIFEDHRMEDFYRTTGINLFLSGNASIHWAEKNQRIIAVEFYYHFNKTIYAIQSGFDASSEFSKYSPSNLIIYHIMKTGIDNGFLVFDWLRGTETYKSSTTNLILQNYNLKFSCKGPMSAFRISVSDVFAALLTKLRSERSIMSVHLENFGLTIAFHKYIKRLLNKTVPKSK